MTGSRRLIVMRHGKAEPFAATDHERALTERGRRSAADAGRHLAEAGLLPDCAVVSPSVRTRSTWEAVAEVVQAKPRVIVDDAVYAGSADVVLDALRGVPPEAETVLFVGHNPSAAYVANLLDDGEGDESAILALLRGFPAGALVVFAVAVPWADLSRESGRVLDFYVGQG